jgi:catechol 2,3-dioxygenase-like lactoylglutathione lyase family enzyme
MKAIHHVGITVPDLDRAIDFYHGVLGLEFGNAPSPVFDSPTLGPAVGVPGANLRQVSLICGESIVELLEYTEPPPPNERPLPQNALGAAHLALRVDDVEATKAELEAKGVEFLRDVNVVDDGVLAGWRWVYFRDPEGNMLELVEEAYTRPEERAAGIAEYKRQRGQRLASAPK